MPDKSWKAQEREVARMLGGQRIPGSGSAQFEGQKGDVLHPRYEIECKYRGGKNLPSWNEVMAWLKTTEERAKESGKIAMVVVRQKSKPDGNILVMRLSTFTSHGDEISIDEIAETVDTFNRGQDNYYSSK